LKKTVGEQGLDEAKPFTGNRELTGEDGLYANELQHMWSNLRFLQERYEESRELAMNASPDPDHWNANWHIQRAFECLIGEKKYKKALTWVDEHDLHAVQKSKVYVASKDVASLVKLVQSLREEDDSGFSDRRIHMINPEGLKKAPFVKALKAIDFKYLGMDDDE